MRKVGRLIMDLKSYLKEKEQVINQALGKFLPGEGEYPEIIHKSMRYSVFAGGKRLRPILAVAAAEAVCGESGHVLPTACALEMIHAYSLIHDDLPALDDDDYRRGKLTNHKVYGEGIALLAGDALLTQAAIVIAQNKGEKRVSADETLAVLIEVFTAAGTFGMLGGQVVDLLSEDKEIDPQTLDYIHGHKTGALIKASVRAGAILSQATDEQLEALSVYADNLGLAFQIKDDLLDIEGDEQKLGKPVGSDAKNKKATYPALYGIEQSRQKARECIETAVKALEIFDRKADPLRAIAWYVVDRDY